MQNFAPSCRCPENDGVYEPQSLDDPDIIDLIESIRAKGVLEPIHISADDVIISGHRRRFCALQAGLSDGPRHPKRDLLLGRPRRSSRSCWSSTTRSARRPRRC